MTFSYGKEKYPYRRTRSSLSTCTNYQFRKFQTARSRLYQSRFLRPNTHFSAFFELYKIHKPSHRSTLKIFRFFANFRKFSLNFRDFCKICQNMCFFVSIFTEFSRNFSEILEKFLRSIKFAENLQIS